MIRTLANTWSRQGDRIVFSLLALVFFAWAAYWFYILPNTFDPAEVNPIPVSLLRDVRVVKDIDPVQLSRADIKSLDLDVVLVFDISGSMEETDPGKLSLTAGRMFIDLLGNKSRLGKIFFNNRVAGSYPLEAVSEDIYGTKETWKSRLDVNFGGGTDFNAPMRSAFRLLNATSQNQKAIIFFTDGIAAADDFREMGSIQSIKVTPLAFGPQSDVSTLERLSFQAPIKINTAKELPLAFAQVFSSLSDSKVQTLTQTGRSYDFATSSDTSGVNLIALVPDGLAWRFRLFAGNQELPISELSSLGYIARDPRYTLIKLEKALIEKYTVPGKPTQWHLLADSKIDQLIMIPLFEFILKAELGKFDPLNKTIPVEKIRLVSGDGTTTITSPTPKFSVVCEGPGLSYVLPLDSLGPNGEARGDIPFDRPGDYRFYFRAETSEFVKETQPVEFSFNETFRIEFPTDTHVLGTTLPGRTLITELIPDNPQVLNRRGELLNIALKDQETQQLSLKGNTVRLSSNFTTNQIQLHTHRGIPLLRRGSIPGIYNTELSFQHPIAGTNTVLVQYTIFPLPWLEQWMPLFQLLGWLGVLIILIIGRVNYTPFPRKCQFIESTFNSSGGVSVKWNKRGHPGNAWFFVKPKKRLPDGSWVEPVKHSNSRLILCRKSPNAPTGKEMEQFNIGTALLLGDDRAWVFGLGHKENREDLKYRISTVLNLRRSKKFTRIEVY